MAKRTTNADIPVLTDMSEPLKRTPNGVDLLVGQRVRVRRIMYGLSQQGLADKIGVSFQQVQKYEKGFNRISASKLQLIASALEVSVHFFFQTGDEQKAIEEDGVLSLLKDRDAVSILRAFSQIRDRNLRRAILEHVRNIAACDDELTPKSPVS